MMEARAIQTDPSVCATAAFHPDMLNIGRAAQRVVEFVPVVGGSIWHTWLESTRARHLFDAIREFIAALDQFPTAGPNDLTVGDLRELGRQIERVTEVIERHIDCLIDRPAEAAPLASAIYVMQSRLERLAHRVRKPLHT